MWEIIRILNVYFGHGQKKAWTVIHPYTELGPLWTGLLSQLEATILDKTVEKIELQSLFM